MDVEQFFSAPEIPVQQVDDPAYAQAGLHLSMLRADLVHPRISGNKWFKLHYNLVRARREGAHTLLSFGGAWSNHLHALAEAGRLCGFRTIGVIRGELPEPLNPCLQDAVNAGMTLHAMSRNSYREKNSPEVLADLRDRFGDFFMIPEGGANLEGILGCADLAAHITPTFDWVCMACGTGAMLAGLATRSTVPLLGFQVLKGKGYLQQAVQANLDHFNLTPTCEWSINDEFHGGGYAKTTPELMAFIAEFERRHHIPLEPVYTGKMLYGLDILKKRDFFPQNSSILVIHSGGLQGRRGFL